MKTPDLFAIAAEINRAAEIEIAANLLPRQTVAFVCDSEGSIDPAQEPTGSARVSVEIQRYRESARTYTDSGRGAIAAEDAAIARVLSAARKHGSIECTGDGSGETGPIACYALGLPAREAEPLPVSPGLKRSGIRH